MRKIQERNFSIQYSTHFTGNPECDLILVTHSQTSSDSMRKWIDFSREFHLKFDVWNINTYKTASYFLKTPSGMTLAEHARGKLIVILNDKFHNEEAGVLTQTMDYVPKDDILSASINHNVATFVVGEDWNLRRATEPLR